MRRLLALCAALALGLATAGPAAAAGVFRINNGAEPESIDPVVVTGVPEGRIMMNLFEGLYANDPKTLDPVPGVAQRHTLSKDGKVYTFYLNPAAKWTNGRQVTADDFVYSWERMLNPKSGAKYAQQLYYLRNGEAYNKGQVTDFKQVGVKAVNPTTLEVTLERPTAYFLFLTTFHALYPVPKEAVEQHGKDWTKPGKIVSNGPFRMVEWVPQQSMVLEKNPTYWDARTVVLDRVVFNPTDDMNTSVKMFAAGETDWVAGTMSAAQVDQWRNRPEYYAEPYLGTYYFRFNTTRPPFNDARVRKAFSMAIDRETLTQRVTRAGEIPWSGFVPKSMPKYQSVKGVDYDPAGAKKLLAEAGYPDGKGLPPVELVYNTNELHRSVTQAVQQMWKQHLGVDVQLTNVEWKVYLNRQKELDYSITRAGWIGDYVDPNTFLDMWVTGGGNNQTGWSNPKYDQHIRQAAETADPEQRMKILQQAETILVRDEVPIAPLWTYVGKGLVNRKFDGWHGNILDWHPMKWIRPKQ